MIYLKRIIVVVCTGMNLLAYAEKTSGIIIFSSDNKEEVIFDIPIMFGAINYVKLQEKVKYTDSFGEKKLLRPEQTKEITFSYGGENIRMISIPKSGDISLGTMFSSSENIFLKLEIEGKLNMFYYEYRQTNTVPAGPTGVSTSYMTTEDKYLLQKGKEGLKWPRTLTFRKDMIAYFSDCPELAEKIEKKEFKRDDMHAIVKFYNSFCN